MLLATAYYEQNNRWQSVSFSDDNQECALIVFSILFDLGLGHVIKELVMRGVVDETLPAELSTLTSNLKGLQGSEDIAVIFHERQWRFVDRSLVEKSMEKSTEAPTAKSRAKPDKSIRRWTAQETAAEADLIRRANIAAQQLVRGYDNPPVSDMRFEDNVLRTRSPTEPTELSRPATPLFITPRTERAPQMGLDPRIMKQEYGENFANFENQGTASADKSKPLNDSPSSASSQVSVATKRSLIPMHIPTDIRKGRARRLSEPAALDDFRDYSYRNLPVLEKANRDVIQKLKAETMQQYKQPDNEGARESSSQHIEVSKVEPSIIPFSDSGYASLDPKRSVAGNNTTGSVNSTSEDDETMTIYSTSSTQSPDSTQEAYIREFANDLMSQLAREDESHDDFLIDRICTKLDRDLQAFARITGHLGRSQEARDVMVFVSRHRK
jgi:hypothetical protein